MVDSVQRWTVGDGSLTMDLGPAEVEQAQELLREVRRNRRSRRKVYPPITADDLYPQARTLCRVVAMGKRRGERHRCPVEVIDGSSEPTLRGRPYHWVTPGGRPVYYPSAYRRAYGRPVYVGSTLHVVVGREWLRGRI